MTELPARKGHPAAVAKEPLDPNQAEYEKGQEFLKNSEPALAVNAFHNALLGFEECGDEKGVANASDKLGDLCLERQDFAKAISHFEKAYAICDQEGDDFSLLALQHKIAKARRGLQEYEVAVAIYFEILDSFQRFNNPAKAVETLTTIADTYLEMGDRDKAADALRAAAAIHQSFKHSRQAQQLLTRAEAVARGA
jgi:tetratricopeptide (TPR) repeat protein